MVSLLHRGQLSSAVVAEAPAATSCYSPQIHWVSVRGKSGEFSPNIQPPPNLSTLQQIKFWRNSAYQIFKCLQRSTLSDQNNLIVRSRLGFFFTVNYHIAVKWAGQPIFQQSGIFSSFDNYHDGECTCSVSPGSTIEKVARVFAHCPFSSPFVEAYLRSFSGHF